MDAVLIPAYEPDEQLIQLAKRLREKVVRLTDTSLPLYRKTPPWSPTKKTKAKAPL